MPVQHHQRGQVLVLFVLAFLALVLVVGLVIDGSFAWVKRRQAQNAADFAALAGAHVVLLAKSDSSLDNADVATAILDTADHNDHAVVTGFGTNSGPQYTNSAGGIISPVDGVDDHGTIPSAATGVRVTSATVTWQPFILGIIGIDRWSAGADAVARFTQTSSPPPCGLCVLGSMPTSSSGTVTVDSSIMIGLGTSNSSSTSVVSNNGNICIHVGNGSNSFSSSGTLQAKKGSVYSDGSVAMSSSGSVSADDDIDINGSLTSGSSSANATATNGSINVKGDVDLSSSAKLSAPKGSISIGGDATLDSSASVSAPKGSVYIGGDASLKSSASITGKASVMIAGDLTQASSGSVNASGGTVAVGGAIDGASKSFINASTIQYVDSFDPANLTPTPIKVSNVDVADPTIDSPCGAFVDGDGKMIDPWASSVSDATDEAKVLYPAYPNSLVAKSESVGASKTGDPVVPTAGEIWSVSVASSGNVTISPGVYRSLTCSSSARLTLTAGTYFFDTGTASPSTAFDIGSSCTVNVQGGGAVTLVFLGRSGFHISSSASVSLQAPGSSLSPSSTYPWPGIAVYFARGNTATMEMASSGSGSITGAIYGPDATLKLSSSGNVKIKSTVLVGNFTASSSASLTVQDDSDGGSVQYGGLQLVK